MRYREISINIWISVKHSAIHKISGNIDEIFEISLETYEISDFYHLLSFLEFYNHLLFFKLNDEDVGKTDPISELRRNGNFKIFMPIQKRSS